MQLTTTESRPRAPDAEMARAAMSAKVLTARCTYRAMPDSEVTRLLLRLVDSGAMEKYLAESGYSTPAQRSRWPVPTGAEMNAAHRDAELRRQHDERMRAIESTCRLSREDRDENAGQMNVLEAVEPEEDETDAERFDGLSAK